MAGLKLSSSISKSTFSQNSHPSVTFLAAFLGVTEGRSLTSTDLDLHTQCFPEPELFSFCNSAAAAKSLQSCPTLCDPTDGSPPGSLVPEIFQARTLKWVAVSFFNA